MFKYCPGLTWSWSPGYTNNIDYRESLSNHNIICKECCNTPSTLLEHTWSPSCPGYYQDSRHGHHWLQTVQSWWNINSRSHTWSAEECEGSNYSWEIPAVWVSRFSTVSTLWSSVMSSLETQECWKIPRIVIMETERLSGKHINNKNKLFIIFFWTFIFCSLCFFRACSTTSPSPPVFIIIIICKYNFATLPPSVC